MKYLNRASGSLNERGSHDFSLPDFLRGGQRPRWHHHSKGASVEKKMTYGWREENGIWAKWGQIVSLGDVWGHIKVQALNGD